MALISTDGWAMTNSSFSEYLLNSTFVFDSLEVDSITESFVHFKSCPIWTVRKPRWQLSGSLRLYKGADCWKWSIFQFDHWLDFHRCKFHCHHWKKSSIFQYLFNLINVCVSNEWNCSKALKLDSYPPPIDIMSCWPHMKSSLAWVSADVASGSWTPF